VPRLHVITDDATLAAPSFARIAAALLDAGRSRVAMHVRGRATSAAAMFSAVRPLVDQAAHCGAVLLVNDRVDIALCAGAGGVQLGKRSVPVAAARTLLPHGLIGYSAHAGAEAAAAARDGADFIVAGSIWETRSHPGALGGGTAFLESVATGAAVPVIAIGGVTPDRVGRAVRAGAHGIAVLSGVWATPDPAAALDAYLTALDAVGMS
jgi:thiamine-phosphate diphosphorylase